MCGSGAYSMGVYRCAHACLLARVGPSQGARGETWKTHRLCDVDAVQLVVVAVVEVPALDLAQEVDELGRIQVQRPEEAAVLEQGEADDGRDLYRGRSGYLNDDN